MPALPAVVKTEAGEGEEEADFGGADEEASRRGPPQRALPDYGDLLDDDEAAVVVKPKQAKEEDQPAAAARKEAIFVGGVQRLTRTHLAEIFEVKSLPLFKWVEWIEDDKVLCCFEKKEESAKALRGCLAGFHDIVEESPGPGLWRAQRCMLDFREATQADRPATDFKRPHRGGKQVREYRFWECMKDADSYILAGEDRGLKRSAPSGEDAFAAAEWDDDSSRRKRLRRGINPGEDDKEDIDLLRMMATQDKAILTKEEADPSVRKSREATLSDVKVEEGRSRWQAPLPYDDGDDDDGWRNRRGGGSWGRERDPWQHDDRGGYDRQGWDDWKDGGKDKSWDDADHRGQQRRGKGGGRGKDGDGPRAGGERVEFAVPMDDAEQAKRSARADRFKTVAKAPVQAQPAAEPASAPTLTKQEA